MSAVLVSKLASGIVYLLRGDRPLVLRANRKLRALAYASEARFLDVILEDLPGWRPLPLPPMTLARFDHADIFHPAFHPIDFIAQETRRCGTSSSRHALNRQPLVSKKRSHKNTTPIESATPTIPMSPPASRLQEFSNPSPLPKALPLISSPPPANPFPDRLMPSRSGDHRVHNILLYGFALF